MVATQQECVWVMAADATAKLPPSCRSPQGFSECIMNRREKEEWEKINVVGCTLLGVSKRKKIQGYRASSLCPL